jgi:hypothetical protein
MNLVRDMVYFGPANKSFDGTTILILLVGSSKNTEPFGEIVLDLPFTEA